MLSDQLRQLISRNESKTTRLSTHIEFLDQLDIFFANYGRELLAIVEAHEHQQTEHTPA